MEQDMHNEKPVKKHWSNKLEETSSLTALLLEDKNASWEKLHNRLQPKPQRISRAWYWFAAACVLVICSIPLFITNDKQAYNNSDSLGTAAAARAASIIARPDKDNTFAADLILPIKTMTTIVMIQTAAGKKIKAESQPMDTVQLSDKVDVQIETTLNATAIIPAEDKSTEPMIALVTTAKPTLRVVHINELGDAVPERSTARVVDEGFIKFKIMYQQINTSTSATAKAIGFNTSKSSLAN